MSWRREFRAGALALGVLVLLGVTGAAFAVPWTSTTARIAAASGTGAGTGVSEVVNEAGQDRTLAYWTAKRMWATAQVETQAAPAASVPKGTPRAVVFSGSPTTGALFYTTGGKAHFCSASVVDSTTGDLVLTAAHCVYSKGFATNVVYVPQYHNGKQPYGMWPVRAIMVANGWQRSHDPDLDFAFLTVGTANGPSIQKRTGGLAIGFNRAYDEKIEVIGHNDSDNNPVRCATHSFKFSATQMEFYCHGFWTGTSGGPWIADYNAKTGTGIVFGVIGGYEAGGNFEWASYSAYFGSATLALYKQAQAQHQSTPAPKPSPKLSPKPNPSPTASLAPTASSSPTASTSPAASSPPTASSPTAAATSPAASSSPAASTSPTASSSPETSSSPAASTSPGASASPSPSASSSTGSATPTKRVIVSDDRYVAILWRER